MNDRMTIVYKLKFFLLLSVLLTLPGLSVSGEVTGFTDNPALYNQAEPFLLISVSDLENGSSVISELADAGFGNSFRVGLGRVGNGWAPG
ncbi:MAG: hypothetical protein RQ801_13860 [Spirochaetaceae bacterium]|nr:hypothetical protein [Spirochaetaceae bacterium]MDT8299386.1 hypothetical protein [Spirochaetaceae bacterium]